MMKMMFFLMLTVVLAHSTTVDMQESMNSGCEKSQSFLNSVKSLWKVDSSHLTTTEIKKVHSILQNKKIQVYTDMFDVGVDEFLEDLLKTCDNTNISLGEISLIRKFLSEYNSYKYVVFLDQIKPKLFKKNEKMQIIYFQICENRIISRPY